MDFSVFGSGLKLLIYLGIVLVVAFVIGSNLGFIGGLASAGWFALALILTITGLIVFVKPLFG